MSDLVFPLLPGMQMERSRSPSFSTTVHESVSGHEVRQSWVQSVRFTYSVQIKARSGTAAPSPWAAYSEKAIVEYFFDVHRGRWDSFLFPDEEAGGEQVRVRFADDSLDIRRLAPGLYEIGLELVSVL